MPEPETDGNLSASGLLAMELDELANLLKNNRAEDGSFDISGRIDPRQFSRSQQNRLRNIFREASEIVTAGDSNHSIETGDLFARLQNIAVNANGAARRGSPLQFQECDGSRSSSSSQETDVPLPVSIVDEESFHRSQLETYGGRPACSVETWQHIINHPEDSCAVLQPWLLKPEDAAEMSVEKRHSSSLSIVFSQQLARWWEFEKWQWMNRDAIAGSGEAAFRRYLGSMRESYTFSKSHKALAEKSFESTTRSSWDALLASLEPTHGRHNFASYHRQLKTLLAPYPFAKSLQLRKDPRTQTALTTWLEYLGFELWCLDNEVYDAELKENRYREAWTTFLQDACDIEQKRARPGNPQLRQPVKSLSEATDYLQTAETAIATFVKRTAPYREQELVTKQQRARVDWIVKEAHVMIEGKKQSSRVRVQQCGQLWKNSSDVQLIPIDTRQSRRLRTTDSGYSSREHSRRFKRSRPEVLAINGSAFLSPYSIE